VERRRCDTLSHTYVQNVIHIVFSTKERRKVILRDMKERVWSYVAGICKQEKIFVHAVGGMEDHIHLLLQIPPTMTLAEAVRTVKSNSSSWMKQEIKKFAWQEGYSGFSVSKSKIPVVIRYIKNQERHHKKMSFEDEFLVLLEKHGIEFDPKYIFG
ncbi:MAG TPA: IS200/IS605 family transposase, partial [Rhabdochlamydiaceae bacterium]